MIIEKPFGDSLETAEEYREILARVFDKEDVYFMDSFLGWILFKIF